MQFELTAKTEPGARLVALAETLAEDFATRAACHDREASYPFEDFRALRSSGYFAAPIPEEHGGLGVTSTHDVVVASSRLARGDASVAIGVNMHLVAVLNIVRRWQMAVAAGNERRADAFARSMESVARDGMVMAAAISEPTQDITQARDDRRPHRVGLAHQRPQDLLHDVACGERPLHGGHVSRRGRRRALRLRAHPDRRSRRHRARRLGCHGHAGLGQQLGHADRRRAARGRAARWLPGRRPRALHGAEPRRRPLPRVVVARDRRVRARDRDRDDRQAGAGRRRTDADARRGERDGARPPARRSWPARRRSSTTTTPPTRPPTAPARS